MKVGIDFHGVIDKYPKFFSRFSKSLIANGDEVHIITGQSWKKIGPKVKNSGVQFTHYFSIVDYHQKIGTKMWKQKGTWWMDESTWNSSKGMYIDREGIVIHFDDNFEYVGAIHPACSVIIVPTKNFEEHMEKIIKTIGATA